MIIAVDFDLTIHQADKPKPGRRMGPPIEGAVEAMKALKAAGNTLIIHTVWPSDCQQHVRDWLDYYEVPWDDVTNVKPNADWFVDDRAIGFRGDWAKVLEEIYGQG